MNAGNAVSQGFNQGVHDALAMNPDTLVFIGVLGLLAIAAVGLLMLRGIYRWFTR